MTEAYFEQQIKEQRERERQDDLWGKNLVPCAEAVHSAWKYVTWRPDTFDGGTVAEQIRAKASNTGRNENTQNNGMNMLESIEMSNRQEGFDGETLVREAVQSLGYGPADDNPQRQSERTAALYAAMRRTSQEMQAHYPEMITSGPHPGLEGKYPTPVELSDGQQQLGAEMFGLLLSTNQTAIEGFDKAAVAGGLSRDSRNYAAQAVPALFEAYQRSTEFAHSVPETDLEAANQRLRQMKTYSDMRKAAESLA